MTDRYLIIELVDDDYNSKYTLSELIAVLNAHLEEWGEAMTQGQIELSIIVPPTPEETAAARLEYMQRVREYLRDCIERFETEYGEKL